MDQWGYFLLVVTALSALTSVPGQTDSDTSYSASFHGSQVSLSYQRSTSLSVSLSFKTALKSAIILTTSDSQSSQYIALGLNHTQLLVFLHQDSPLEPLNLPLDNITPSPSEWHSLSLSLLGTSLQLALDGVTLSHSLGSAISYTTVNLGGPESFLSSDLPLSEYFIGCMSNVSINNANVGFHPRRGIRTGCCAAVRPLSYCFEDAPSSIGFKISTDVTTTDISFQIRASQNGNVFSAQSDSTSISAVLLSDNLTVYINSTVTVQCQGNVIGGMWHSVRLTFNPSSISCDLDGVLSHVSLRPPISSPSLTQISFGAPNTTSFSGCVRRPQLNGRDLSPGTASGDDVDRVIRYNQVQWSDVQFDIRPLSVMEGERKQLTGDNIRITLPDDIYSDRHGSWYEEEIHRAIHVEVVEGPVDGYFTQGNTMSRMSDFTYHDIISLDRAEQVVYHHGGSMNVTDSASLEVWVDCQGKRQVVHETSLEIEVSLRNDIPVISRRQTMEIAVGTIRVITSDIITASDEETKDPNLITYTFDGTTSPSCGSCTGGERVGDVVRTRIPSLGVRYFSQAEINDGSVSFKHYPTFGIADVSIHLTVSDSYGGSTNTTINVRPFEGHISLTSETPECLFVKEKGFSLLRSSHLNASTDFQDQNPVLTYDIVDGTQFGVLQKWTTFPGGVEPTWITLDKRHDISQFIGQSFTQDDLDNQRIRYVNHNITGQDVFSYQLRSTNLLGPSGNFCINVIADYFLLTPTIQIEIHQIDVEEGGNVTIDDNTLVATLDATAEYFFLDNDQPGVDTDQLEIVYFLVSVPSYGSLQLNNVPLRTGDNFTERDIRAHYLEYIHSGSEDHDDSFTIYGQAVITDDLLLKTPNATSEVTAHISVAPLNNHAPRLDPAVVPIKTAEGGFVTVTTENINIIDDDGPGDNIYIILRNPRHEHQSETPIGYFAFSSDPMTKIRRFYLDDVRNRRVIFKHVMKNKDMQLNYTQRLRIDDGNSLHTLRTSITVKAIPLKVSVSLHSPSCVANLDAVDPNASFALNFSLFSFMLMDHFGNDSNLILDIQVSVTNSSVGDLRSRNTGSVVSQFFVVDIRHGTIEYHLQRRNVTRDSFELEFTYGHSKPVLIPIQVCINPRPIPSHIEVGELSVEHGGVAVIGSTHLWANSTRGSADTLEFRITQHPQLGSIINRTSDEEIQNFTQADLNANRTAYNQNKEPGLGRHDSFQFMVCSEYNCSTVHTFPISIILTDIIVKNTGFSVVEESNHTISLSEMDISAPENYINKKFIILRNPLHGRLFDCNHDDVDSFSVQDIETNSVCYENDGHEFLHDSFEFDAIAKSSDTEDEDLHVTGIVNITIIPVNDHPPESVFTDTDRKEIQVAKGGSLTLSTNWLRYHDFDSDTDDEDLEYILLGGAPFTGYFYLDKDTGPSGKIGSWTEGELRQGRVSYKQNLPLREPEFTDLLYFSVSDGELMTKKHIIIQVKSIVYQQCGDSEATVGEGGRTNITIRDLCYEASNDHSLMYENYIYTIVELPSHGQLEFNSTLLQINATFSQQALQEGHLCYTHDHSNPDKDHFKFNISVNTRQTISTEFTFNIHVESVDDDPPNATIMQDPIFVPELSKVVINDKVIDIVDLDSSDDKQNDDIVCTVIRPPRYGLLPRTKFGLTKKHSNEFTKFDLEKDRFGYKHTILGTTEDSFTFNVTDGVNHQNETYTVNIVILPNEVELRVQPITVLENGDVNLMEEFFLEVEHDYIRSINGLIQISDDGEPQYGVFTNTSDCSNVSNGVSVFSTEEMKNGSIVYCHGGSEHPNDSFRFVYTSEGPEGNERSSREYSVHIEVTPRNDQPPVLFENRSQELRPWAGDIVPLTRRYLNASDGDTPDIELAYSVTLLNNDGYIAFTDDVKHHVREFTQVDVNEGRVVYVHQSDRTGTLVYTVTDQTYPVQGNISIFAKDLTIRCTSEHSEQLTVMFKRSVAISPSHLGCTTNDDQIDRPISYALHDVRHGHFEVNGEERSGFNSSDLVRAGAVIYVHTDVDYWEPEEKVRVVVSTPLAVDKEITLVIGIDYPNGEPLAVNTGLVLKEGGEVCLNEYILDARNLRYQTYMEMNRSVALDSLQIQFQVTELPSRGTITMRGHVIEGTPTFTQDDIIEGVVCYRHDNSENYIDSIPFTLSVSQSVAPPISLALAISITPINDEIPYIKTTPPTATPIILGFNKVLTRQLLEVGDNDTPPSRINYTVTSLPNNTDLVLSGKVLREGNTFTQADINQGVLELHPIVLGSSALFLSVRDENTTLDGIQFSLMVINQSLELLDNKRVEYRQNQLFALITSDLLNTSTNGLRDETRFIITSEPSDGSLMIGRSVVGEFKQLDVDKELVKYVPRSTSQRHMDEFTVEVRNRDKVIEGVIIHTAAVVLGKVKEMTELDFKSVDLTDTSLPLPAGMLSLDKLQSLSGSLPLITVINTPRYGRLERRYDVIIDRTARQADGRTARQAENGEFSFWYNELKQGWVYYAWQQSTVTAVVNDSFTVLVSVSGMKPGEAVITLSITPPPLTTTPLTPSQSTTDNSLSTEIPSQSQSDGGFPMYVLVPIIGVFFILVLVIVVVVVFCLTQQNKIKKKLQPNVGSSSHTHHPISPSTVPRPIFSPRYHYDPSAPSATLDSDNEERDSDTSSGFSESISPRHSPTHSPRVYTQISIPQMTSSLSHLSPAFSQAPPSRARVRSNVSITYSGRNSVTSDYSVDDSPEVYAHSLPRQHFQLSVPVPIRPASHAAFRNTHRGLPMMESGYGSINNGTRETSVNDVVMTTDCDDMAEESHDTPSINQSRVLDHMTFPDALDGDTNLPEFSNPKLFRLTNLGPVLKKEEYWV